MLRRFLLLSWLIVPMLMIIVSWSGAFQLLANQTDAYLPVTPVVFAQDQWHDTVYTPDQLSQGFVTIWFENTTADNLPTVIELMHTRNLRGVISYQPNADLNYAHVSGLAQINWDVHLTQAPDTWCVQTYNSQIHQPDTVQKYLSRWNRKQINITGFDSQCQTLHPLIIKQFNQHHIVHRTGGIYKTILGQNMPEVSTYVPASQTNDPSSVINQIHTAQSSWIIISLDAAASRSDLEQTLNGITASQLPILTVSQVQDYDWSQVAPSQSELPLEK